MLLNLRLFFKVEATLLIDILEYRNGSQSLIYLDINPNEI